MTNKQIIENLETAERIIAKVRLAMSDSKQRFMGHLTLIICDEFKIEQKDFLGPRRHRGLPDARFIFAYHAKKYTTWKEIGEFLGGKDHSTASYYYDRYQELYDLDNVFTSHANMISKKIEEYERQD